MSTHWRALILIALSLAAMPSASRSSEPPRRLALLIGINQYERNRGPRVDFWNLGGCDNDVRQLKAVLEKRFQFADRDVLVLTRPEETTRAGIVDAFRRHLIAQVRPGDVVWFHFSGHGKPIADDNGDELDGMDESLVPSDYVNQRDGSQNLRDDLLGTLLEELKGKRPANVTVSLDCCFSGTATRGEPPAGRLRERGRGWSASIDGPLPPRPRGESTPADGPAGVLPRGAARAEGYVLLSACRSDQTAKEKEDEAGSAMGALTYHLVRTLDRATPTTTYRSLHERLELDLAADVPAQNAQLEGEMDQLLLQGSAVLPPAYLRVNPGPGGAPMLAAGELQGMTAGSRFALYPAGTTQFDAAHRLAEADIADLQLTSARLELLPAYRGKVSAEALAAARAVEIAHHYGDQRLRVAVDDLNSVPGGAAVVEALRKLSVVELQRSGPAAWDLRVRGAERPPPARGGQPAVRQLLVERKDGSVLAAVAFGAGAAPRVAQALRGEARWRFLQRLENTDTHSLVRMELRLVLVEAEEVRDGEGRFLYAKAKRDREPQRSPGGQLILRPGDYFVLELRNPGPLDAYVTILDLRTDGTVGPIWPHPDVRIQENKIAADEKWHRLPPPFIYAVEEPLGREVVKAIATREPADFSPLLQAAARGAADPGGPTSHSPIGQLLWLGATGTRASLKGQEVDPRDWWTASVLFDIAARPREGRR